LKVSKCEFLENKEGILLSKNSQGTVKNSNFIRNVKWGIKARENTKLKTTNCKFAEQGCIDMIQISIIERGAIITGMIIEDAVKSFLPLWPGSIFKGVNKADKIDSSFYGSETGGGLYGVDNSQIEVLECEFLNNAQGILLTRKSHGTVKISTFDRNLGGIIAEEDASAEVKSCEFVGNGIGIGKVSGAKVEVENCNFSKNIRDIYDI
jgi:hypothetical protein